MKMSLLRKANWIASELNENADDVYDVLLGNITSPWEFYNSVETLSNQYDRLYSKMIEKEI
jgi:hypothetical protein